jgi:DNA-binding response OmpR family regulator
MPSKATILIVDDDAHIRQSLTYFLQKAGYSVTATGDPQEALQCLQAGPFDLIFLDLKMPGMDGITLLERIRAAYPDTPVFMLTGHAALSSAIEAMRRGASDYFVKPVQPQEILERVEQVLDKVREQRRRREIANQMASLLNELRQIDNLEMEDGDEQAALSRDVTHILQRGPFLIDLQARQARLGQQSLRLQPTSFDYLVALLRRSPEPVSYEDLVLEIQGYELTRNEARDIARWQIYQLRQALEPDSSRPQYILTERGFGYRLAIPNNHKSG